jgi:hypothetical protein
MIFGFAITERGEQRIADEPSPEFEFKPLLRH